MGLTPEQRHDLITQAMEARLALGLYISKVSVQPWLLERDAILALYNNLAELDRLIYLEMEWPSPRPGLRAP